MTVHAECVDELDKTCSEVSEGCVGRKGEGNIKLGLVRASEGVQVGIKVRGQ